jgi:hypothetical protein
MFLIEVRLPINPSSPLFDAPHAVEILPDALRSAPSPGRQSGT